MAAKSLPLSKILKLEEKAKMLGFSERLLIENASSNLTEAICSLGLGEKILVVAGKGNNGADSLAAARKLISRGFRVKVVIIKEKELNAEVLFQKSLLVRTGCPLRIITPGNTKVLKKFLKTNDCVLDGILGIGIKGRVPTFLKQVIGLINASKKIIIACDIPSGLSPEAGLVCGAAIKADYTITFLAPKRGFFLNHGPHCCGKIIVVDIGLSQSLLEKL
ncbi:MAG: NAD(P)H-hydrate epimerase [Candidatus Omnitrophica bacterium]|nr:NAD(P)H-hydrate epimerase [Candidatus Omnitrophota bacterium]